MQKAGRFYWAVETWLDTDGNIYLGADAAEIRDCCLVFTNEDTPGPVFVFGPGQWRATAMRHRDDPTPLTRAQLRRWRHQMREKLRGEPRLQRNGVPPGDDEIAWVLDIMEGKPLPPAIEAEMRRIAFDTAIRGETAELREFFTDYVAAVYGYGRA
jgi:hypothetical protein